MKTAKELNCVARMNLEPRGYVKNPVIRRLGDIVDLCYQSAQDGLTSRSFVFADMNQKLADSVTMCLEMLGFVVVCIFSDYTGVTQYEVDWFEPREIVLPPEMAEEISNAKKKWGKGGV